MFIIIRFMVHYFLAQSLINFCPTSFFNVNDFCFLGGGAGLRNRLLRLHRAVILLRQFLLPQAVRRLRFHLFSERSELFALVISLNFNFTFLGSASISRASLLAWLPATFSRTILPM